MPSDESDSDGKKYMYFEEEGRMVPLENWYQKRADDYQKQLEEYHQKKKKQKNLFSTWVVLISLLGGVYTLYISVDVLTVPPIIEGLLWIPAGIFALIAFGGIVGVARLTVVDLILRKDALR